MPTRPERLNLGDTVGVVAPASAPADPAKVQLGLHTLEEMGFKPKPAPHLSKRWGFLAGSDRDRAADLMRMFTDPKVKAILCLRGGYGAARLLPLLDFGVIRSHPKILIGYSDITSLHCALLVKANLVSFHGPMLASDLIKKHLPDFTVQSLIRTISQPQPPGSICQGYTKSTIQVLRPGRASGRLIGGNISILCATLGTPYQPSFQRRILFFEDLDEVPYRFDRMLTHLLNARVLQQVAGIAIGVNCRCEDPKARTATEYRQSLLDVLKERLTPLKVPVVVGLPFGHIPHNTTLPVGVRATLDGIKGDLVITEPGVT